MVRSSSVRWVFPMVVVGCLLLAAALPAELPPPLGVTLPAVVVLPDVTKTSVAGVGTVLRASNARVIDLRGNTVGAATVTGVLDGPAPLGFVQVDILGSVGGVGARVTSVQLPDGRRFSMATVGAGQQSPALSDIFFDAASGKFFIPFTQPAGQSITPPSVLNMAFQPGGPEPRCRLATRSSVSDRTASIGTPTTGSPTSFRRSASI